jgi:CDP-4-dehydro-6-deoxyglucose reductase
MSSARTIYKMKVDQIIDHTDIVRELVISASEPANFQFKAGQFVMLHVPQPEGKPALRAYSIASTEERKDGFHLLFKFVDNGVASKFVWSLKGHEELQFTGPFGRVFFKEPPTEQIIFLNTGTGLSQHYSYLVSKMRQYPDLKYRMLFGIRSEKDIYYQPQLEALKKDLKDFQYEYVLSRPQNDWTGKKGYVQNFISEFNYMNIESTFYLCGNGGMIKDVKAILETQGFDKTRVHSEAFD